MTYKATLKVSFDTEWNSTHYSSGYDDSMLPEEHYTFQVPAEDLNTYQLFTFFATVARAMGHDDINIMKGGCSLAFGEHRREEDMRKVADEFELTLAEDLQGKFKDWKEADEEWARLKKGPMGTVVDDCELDDKDKCREYNMREAEYYNKRAKLDLQQQKDLIGLD